MKPRSPTELPGVAKIYSFRDFRNIAFAAADQGLVLACFGSESTFSTFFGGFERWGGTFLSPAFLGVWGTRNAARLRRLLRERTGELEIVPTEPPAGVRSYSVTGVRLSRQARDDLERQFKALWPKSFVIH